MQTGSAGSSKYMMVIFWVLCSVFSVGFALAIIDAIVVNPLIEAIAWILLGLSVTGIILFIYFLPRILKKEATSIEL